MWRRETIDVSELNDEEILELRFGPRDIESEVCPACGGEAFHHDGALVFYCWTCKGAAGLDHRRRITDDEPQENLRSDVYRRSE